MYVVTDKGGGIACIIIALVFLGTWPALFNLLERRGRIPSHTFLDYALTNFLVAVVIALTLGEIGRSTPQTPNFTVQVHQDNGPAVGFAIAGGVLLFLGNLGTQYALAFTGLSITEVVASSLTVVGGTTLNYFLDDRINKATILFPGVGCFLIAAILGLFLHASNMDDVRAKLGTKTGSWLSKENLLSNGEADVKAEAEEVEMVKGHQPVYKDEEAQNNLERRSLPPAQMNYADRGNSEFLAAVEERRAIKTGKSGALIGGLLLIAVGGCYILFSPAVNLATNDQWHFLKPGVPNLVIYTAFFYFSAAFFFCSLVFNITLLYFPILGIPKSNLTAYAMDWGWNRIIAFCAGIICGLGNTLQFMGGQAAGYAAADAVQALPLVSTFWGIVLFGEYFKSSRRSYIFLAAMLIMFVVAVGLLIGSAGQRKDGQ
ncbi:hypothetical protein WJX73_001796 [Symbiochloris irregularis]|uniref:Ureide permease n=1 Tax=Symbiochloris irregularis TaxID=706552 RepID=A0AAW1NRW9_9CHLO